MMSDPIDREIALAREAARALTEAPLDPVRRARLWSRIENAPSAPAPRSLAWRWVASGAALAAGLALWSTVGPEELRERPLEQPRSLNTSERFEVMAGVKLRVEPGASVVRSEPSKLELLRGALLISVNDPAEPMTLLTSEVRITALNARFSLERTPGRTAVSVHSGRIEWVAALDPGTVRQLVAGTSTAVEAKRVEERRAPVSPKPRVTDRPRPRRKIEPARAIVQKIDAAERMALADEHRRAGRAEEAWETYGRVAGTAGVGPLLEEALLRQAQLSAELDRRADGLRLLSEIDERVGKGLLGPERTALAVELHLSQGEVEEAAAALEANRSGALVLDRARIQVAERLRERDPTRARALLEIVLNGSAPASTLEDARRLMGEDR